MTRWTNKDNDRAILEVAATKAAALAHPYKPVEQIKHAAKSYREIYEGRHPIELVRAILPGLKGSDDRIRTIAGYLYRLNKDLLPGVDLDA